MVLKESFWTWLADVTMPGLTIPSLLIAWGLGSWLGWSFEVSLLLSVFIVVGAVVVGAMLATRGKRTPIAPDSREVGDQ